MNDLSQDLIKIVEEFDSNNYKTDSIGISFNNLGIIKFKNLLSQPTPGLDPIYILPINKNNIISILNNIKKLFPYQKGLILKLVAPQKRRKLVNYINDMILDYINRKEIDHSISIINELSANGEKANIEDIILKNNLVNDKREIPSIIRNEREMLLDLCDKNNKWVKISWKFTHKIFKVEVKNNTTIDPLGLEGIKEKVSHKLNTIADGFMGEIDEKIGAGLGLYFVNFFKDEVKEKYDFETIFRIYENDLNETVASLTVIFEKD